MQTRTHTADLVDHKMRDKNMTWVPCVWMTTYRRIWISFVQIVIQLKLSAFSTVSSSWTIAPRTTAITGSTGLCCFIINKIVAVARCNTATFLLVIGTLFTMAVRWPFTTYTFRVTGSALLHTQRTKLCKLEEASTHKTAKTHTSTVSVPRDLDLLTPK